MTFQLCLQLLHTVSININRSLGNPTNQQREDETPIIFERAVLENPACHFD